MIHDYVTIYVLVNKCHEITKTNNVLVHLSVVSNFPGMSVTLSPEPIRSLNWEHMGTGRNNAFVWNYFQRRIYWQCANENLWNQDQECVINSKQTTVYVPVNEGILWLINMYLIVFEQQWSSVAQICQTLDVC